MLKSRRGGFLAVALAALLATFLISPVSAEEKLETLGPKSKGERVVILKNDLKGKGYYTVKGDKSDAYTSALRSAVGVFQIANGIQPVEGYGYADAETQLRAASEDAVYYSDYIQDKQLQPGGSGAYVKKAQTKLNKLGYYSGKANGKYRAPMVAAVKYFQTANELPATGVADGETRARLYATDPAPVTRAKYEDDHFLTPLKYGAKGGQVAHLQGQLQKLGFYWGDPTEAFDAQTRYSVKFFQEANGIKATGGVSKALRAKINDGPCVSFDEYAANMHLVQLSSRAKPGVRVAVLQRRLQELGYYKGLITGAYTGPVIAAVRTFQIFNNLSSKYVTGKANLETRKRMLAEAAPLRYDAVCGDDTLRPGSTGEAVKALQARLKALGYYNGELNGVYGSVVASAVKVFQRCNGFYPSGIAYTNVQVALSSSSAVSYTNIKVEQLIKIADSYLGAPYTSPAKPPKSFDCSTFTAYCLKKVGIYVTAEVSAQGRSKIGKKIKNIKEIKRGDILFFDTQEGKKPGHAAIYLDKYGKSGKLSFIHASSTKANRKVVVTALYKDDWYPSRFMWAIRIWE